MRNVLHQQQIFGKTYESDYLPPPSGHKNHFETKIKFYRILQINSPTPLAKWV